MPPRRAPSVLAGAALAAVAGFGACELVGTDDPGSIRSIAAFSIGFEVLLGALAVAVASRLPLGVCGSLGLGPAALPRVDLLWLLAGTLGASHALDSLVDIVGLEESGALAEFEGLIAGIGGSDLLLAAIAFAVAPGVFEELFCRGLIQRLACRRLGTAAGIAVASLVFGALHFDPVHAAFAGVLGVYLGLVCHWSGGVRAAIYCHVLNNGVAVATASRLPELSGGGPADAALGAAIALLALWRVKLRQTSGSSSGGKRRDESASSGLYS